MNEFLSSAAVRLNPLIGIVITLAGALIGGKLAGDAPLGILLGLVGGSAIAIGLCGTIAMLGQVVDAIEQPAQASASVGHAVATAAHPAHAASSHVNGAAGAPASVAAGKDDLAATQAAIRAAAAGDGEAALAGIDAALAEYIKKGDFSGYHVARARKMLSEGNYKDAAYQASAALAHDPANADARALRTAARQNK